MNLKELKGLSLQHGPQVMLRDGREGVLIEVHEPRRYSNHPFVLVNVLNDDGVYGHDEWLWPAQVTV